MKNMRPQNIPDIAELFRIRTEGVASVKLEDYPDTIEGFLLYVIHKHRLDIPDPWQTPDQSLRYQS